LANLVPGILQVEMEKDQSRNQYVIWAKTQDGRCFSSRVLSDGTLRMLALVIIKNNPEHRGVLCLEEPENGVHPSRFKNLIQLLRELATDFSDSTQANEPLRQLLVNTHSPLFVSQTEVLPELLFAHTATRVQPSRAGQPLQVTKIVPLRPHPQIKLDESNHEEAYYTLHQIIDYLHTVDVGEAIAILEGDNGQ
jgi:predicted ATPase